MGRFRGPGICRRDGWAARMARSADPPTVGPSASPPGLRTRGRSASLEEQDPARAGNTAASQRPQDGAPVEGESGAERLPLLGQDPTVVRAVREQQDHDTRRWVVPLLERDAPLDRLDVMEVHLTLHRCGIPAIGQALVPGAQVVRYRELHFSGDAQWRGNHPVEPVEDAKLAAIAEPRPVGVELERRIEAGRTCDLADQAERRVLEITPLKAAQLRPAHGRPLRQHPLADPCRPAGVADLLPGCTAKSACIRSADVRWTVPRGHAPLLRCPLIPGLCPAERSLRSITSAVTATPRTWADWRPYERMVCRPGRSTGPVDGARAAQAIIGPAKWPVRVPSRR